MKLPFDHFDLLAGPYDRLASRSAGDRLKPLIAAGRGMRILDVGGGTGRISTELQEGGARVVVCDLSWQMVRRARSKDIAAVRCSVDALPFAAGSVERVLVVDAFHHFNRESVERTQVDASFELLRVLKTGGRLLIAEPDVARRATRVVAAVEKLMLMGSRMLPAADIVDLFKAAGARLLSSEARDYSVQMVFTK